MNNFRHTGSNKEATLTHIILHSKTCMHAHEHPHCHIHKHSALSINYTFNTKATMLDTPEQKAKLKPQNKSLVHS